MPFQLIFFFVFIAIQIVTAVCKNLNHQEKFRKRNYVRNKHRKSYAKKRYKKKDFKTRHRLRLLPESQLKKIARSLRGKIHFNHNKGVITFSRNHHQYNVEIKSDKRAYSVRLTANWPDRDFRLKIEPDNHNNMFGVRYLGQQDVEIGNPEFDRNFIIETNDLPKTKAILDPTSCKRIQSHKDKAHKRINITVSGGRAEFGGMANEIFATKQIMAIATNFAEIHYLMLNAEAGVLKIEADVVKQEESVCLVCGENVDHDHGISCGACETTYHEDCWKYIGKCSTYGCRSRRAS